MNTSMSRARLLRGALVLAAVIHPAGSQAADRVADPGAIEQVTVIAKTDSPTAPGEAAARAELARVPGGANVVSHDEYADGRASTLADVFAFTPGVFVQPVRDPKS